MKLEFMTKKKKKEEEYESNKIVNALHYISKSVRVHFQLTNISMP